MKNGGININRNRYRIEYKGIFLMSVVFMILMMTITIFSQLAMEIYAYNFVANKNMENKNISYLKNYMEYRQEVINKQNADNNKEVTDEQKIEFTVNKEQKITEVSSVISFILPVKGGVTTSTYGDKVLRASAHQGHDWAVSSGTKVKASADGVVEKAYYSQSYGYNVLVNHGNGFKTRYAHLSKLKVRAGEKIKQNEVLGLSGSTGQSTGPHLHFEIIKNGKRVNPLNYVK